QEPLPCVVVTLGRNEQGEFPNSEGFSRHNLVSLILGVLILAHQFRERRGSVEGLSLRGTVAFKGAAERCCKRRLNCTPFACCGGNNLCCHALREHFRVKCQPFPRIGESQELMTLST